jgi:hypothetical protein
MPELRRLYLDGRNAIIPNLPRPQVRVVADHAFVLLSDCIADALAHGLLVDNITERTLSHAESTGQIKFMSETKRAREIHERAKGIHNLSKGDVICLTIMEWSDGFDMMASAKSNRGSSWIKTITISAPRHGYHGLTNTYAIAIGKSGDSHEEVEAIFASELKSFLEGPPKQFYHGGLKRNVWVHVELFASLMDQPERRSNNCLMLGKLSLSAEYVINN